MLLQGGTRSARVVCVTRCIRDAQSSTEIGHSVKTRNTNRPCVAEEIDGPGHRVSPEKFT